MAAAPDSSSAYCRPECLLFFNVIYCSSQESFARREQTNRRRNGTGRIEQNGDGTCARLTFYRFVLAGRPRLSRRNSLELVVGGLVCSARAEKNSNAIRAGERAKIMASRLTVRFGGSYLAGTRWRAGASQVRFQLHSARAPIVCL